MRENECDTTSVLFLLPPRFVNLQNAATTPSGRRLRPYRRPVRNDLPFGRAPVCRGVHISRGTLGGVGGRVLRRLGVPYPHRARCRPARGMHVNEVGCWHSSSRVYMYA